MLAELLECPIDPIQRLCRCLNRVLHRSFQIVQQRSLFGTGTSLRDQLTKTRMTLSEAVASGGASDQDAAAYASAVAAMATAEMKALARLIGLGRRLGPAAVLTVRGRTTGRARTTPVALFEHNGHRYVVAIFGEVNWVRNLRAAGEGIVTRGRRQAVAAVELTPEVAGRVLKDAAGPRPPSRLLAAFLRRYLKVTPNTGLDAIIEQAGRHPVFELHASSQALRSSQQSHQR